MTPMCELLIRLVDKVNDDPELDLQCLKRGDVVTIQEDGWSWSERERTNPDWMIVKIPGVSASTFNYLMVPEPDDLSDFKHLRRRWNHIDLDSTALPTGVRTALQGGTRKTETVTLDRMVISAAQRMKAPMRDTVASGGDSKVIG